jgi:hypothetical protein
VKTVTIDRESIMRQAMQDIDELLEGEGKNLPSGLRILITQGWLAGYQSGYHTGFDQSSELASKAIAEVSNTIINVMKGGTDDDQ